ncbi:MAG: phosphotyrosine protein phosphatase [Actinocatenispora sp.]
MSGLGAARPPFAVLHICMGNICRSPMAERLLSARFAERIDGLDPRGLLLSHSAGTGGWHAGEGMNPPATRQVTERGGEPDGFAARQLHGEHIDSSDLILTATGEQASYVTALRPDATPRTFALREFGRLLPEVDPTRLPPAALTGDAVLARGVALVAAVDKARGGRRPRDEDDLDDPWGLGDRFFGRIADEIEDPLDRLARILAGG